MKEPCLALLMYDRVEDDAETKENWLELELELAEDVPDDHPVWQKAQLAAISAFRQTILDAGFTIIKDETI